MNCLVCGKEFSLWRRLTGDASDNVCRECEEEGPRRLERLIDRLGPRADRRALVHEFDSTALRFHLPEDIVRPFRGRLLDALATVTAEREELNGADIDLLNEVANRYGILSAPRDTPLGRAAKIISTRLAIQAWEKGEPPSRQCAGLLLEDAEVCHWEEPARLYEQRKQREYVGASQGISVRLARGVYYRIGAFKGSPMDTAYLAEVSEGTLHITSLRIGFTGDQAAVAIAYKKMISVSAFEDGFQVFRTGAKKPTIFQVTQPELTLRLLALATPAKND